MQAVSKQEIQSYTGEGKPKVLVVKFSTVVNTPPDLEKTIVLSAVKSPNRLSIQRMAEIDTDIEPQSSPQDGICCMHVQVYSRPCLHC